MRVALISTYELGRQPFGVASPAAWLERAGHQVLCVDTSRQPLPLKAVADAGLVAIYLPMHTATRLAIPLIEKIRAIRPDAHICCYGLYAPMNAEFLRAQGVQSILGGEFEQALVDLTGGLSAQIPLISLDRLHFIRPDRSLFPQLSSYATLQI